LPAVRRPRVLRTAELPLSSADRCVCPCAGSTTHRLEVWRRLQSGLEIVLRVRLIIVVSIIVRIVAVRSDPGRGIEIVFM